MVAIALYSLPRAGFRTICCRVMQEGLDGTPEILLDPNTLSEDGTSALGGMDFSKDGKKLAYGISEKGSDWSVVVYTGSISLLIRRLAEVLVRINKDRS